MNHRPSEAWQPDESENRDSHSSPADRERGRVTESPKYFLLAQDSRPHGAEMAYVMFPSPNKINLILPSKLLHSTPLFAPTFVWMSSVNCCDPRKYKKSSDRDIARI